MPPHPSGVSQPHSLSLKVLRLSRPTLAQGSTIPEIPAHPSLQKASLAYPSQRVDDAFTLTPLLTLPPSFGAAYVGEAFSCTLCVNNELPGPDDVDVENDGRNSVKIAEVSVKAELQTPSTSSDAGAGIVLEVRHAQEDTVEQDAGVTTEVAPGQSWQGIVRHDLKEEGPHVLAITVGYTEVHPAKDGDEWGESEHRKRQFRKLYQFAAQQAVGVRTKIGELRRSTNITASGRKDDEARAKQLKKFAVEAQIENLTDQNVLLDKVDLELGRALKSVSLNGDPRVKALLAPGDIGQVAFRLDQTANDDGTDLQTEAGRYVLAQLKVDWRMTMGQDGTLRTGWLGCLRRG